MPSLSVVVPTRDTRTLTLRCLATVVPQLPPDAEVIVVDDDSRDDTIAALAATHSAARVVRLAPARGFTRAANAGLAVATGELLWLLNSDTEIAPRAVSALRGAFARNDHLGAAGPLLVAPDGSPQWSGGRMPNARWLFALASGIAANAARLPGYRRWRPMSGHDGRPVEWIPGTALMLRAAAWRAVGPLDETLALYAQDLDYGRRLRAAGWDVALVRAARVAHVGGATVERVRAATTAGQDVAALWTDLVRVVAKHDGAAAATTAARTLAAGGALRLIIRRALRPFVAAGHRADWNRDTAAYARALAAVRRPVSG
jgi:N-acetylglucosaminyl-diphospho-decaprenol L-rhamnosyltransferase